MLLFNFSIPGEVVAILIIIGAIALFTVTFILNRKMKLPEGVELPDKCSACTNTMCREKIEDKVENINKNKIDMTPDELIEYLKCEDTKNGKE